METEISLEQAQRVLESYAGDIGTEKVSIINAHQRISAEDVYSVINQPPFHRSPLDGFALRAEDSKGASKVNPVRLRIIEEVYAGGYPKLEVSPGNATCIMTGAPIPKGANCVIRQEETFEKNGYVEIFSELKSGDNYCIAGEDIKKGECIIKKESFLNFAAIGILASMGVSEIIVYKIPKVAVLSTGDELTDVGEELLPGKIYNSNLYTIGMRLKEFGMDTMMLGSAPDGIEQLCEKIKSALEKTDILITTGGVSVGKKDLIKEAMEKLGANILFWKVRMKPGTPALFSVLNGKLIISLSGNPAAAIITFELLARSVLAKYSHRWDLNLAFGQATLENNFPKESKGRRILRGRYTDVADGRIVELANKHSSGVLSSILHSNCLVDIPAGTASLYKGDKVNIFIL